MLNLLDTGSGPVLGCRLPLASQSKLVACVKIEENRSVPFDPSEFPFMGPDITELLAVLLALAFSFAVMVALGRWWSQ